MPAHKQTNMLIHTERPTPAYRDKRTHHNAQAGADTASTRNWWDLVRDVDGSDHLSYSDLTLSDSLLLGFDSL
jgi:hypothetical protein